MVRRIPPKTGRLKRNTDGVSKSNPGPSFITFCIRDQNGDLVVAGGSKIKDTTSLEAKAIAIRECLKYCRLNFNNQKILESDSQTMVQILNMKLEVPWSVKIVVNSIKSLMGTMSVRVVHSLKGSVVKKCRTTILIKEMDISRLIVHAQKIEEAKNKEKERDNNGDRIAIAPVPKFRDGNKDREPGPKPQGSISSARINPLYQKYGKNHQGVCRADSAVCLGCGKPGHRIKDCPQFGSQGQYNHLLSQHGLLNQQGAAFSTTNG
ncbi:hypothetical protein FXO37_08927 [Capsicum annuum]|nr:hypothetical protein FXO37_08927 [Capsicum annuum]